MRCGHNHVDGMHLMGLVLLICKDYFTFFGKSSTIFAIFAIASLSECHLRTYVVQNGIQIDDQKVLIVL